MNAGVFGEGFPYTNFHDLNMDWIIQVVKKFSDEYPDVMSELLNKVNKPIDNPNGADGDFLRSHGDGTTEWTSLDPIFLQYVYEAVQDWLDEHPEATTTVQDGSLTQAKFTDQLKLETIKDYGTPEMYGGAGNGTSDDTIAFQTALNNHGTVILTKKYKITDTINIPSKRSILFYGNSQIIADIPQGASPLFMLDTVSNVEMIGFGGAEPNIKGVCSIALYIKGENNFAISPSNYSKFIRLKDLWISDNTGIGIGIYLETAVKQLTIDGCTIYCNNAIYSHGKTIETNIDNSIIWGTETGGYAIKIDSPLGTNLYNEGWAITNTTIDTTDKTTGISLSASDFFVLQLSNDYIGTKISIKAPTTTTHSEDFLMSNCELYGTLETDGQATYNMYICNCIIVSKYFNFKNNARYVTIANCLFKGGSSDISGIVLANGCIHFNIHDCRIDSNYGAGIVINGSEGTDINIHDIKYEGTGNIIYSGRAYTDWNTGIDHKTRTAITQGSKAVGATIGTCTRRMAKGTNFMVNIKTTLKGGITTGSGQLLDVTVSNAGGGFYIPFYGGSQFISVCFFGKAANDGDVTVTLTNYQGNAVTTDYHDFIEIMEM